MQVWRVTSRRPGWNVACGKLERGCAGLGAGQILGGVLGSVLGGVLGAVLGGVLGGVLGIDHARPGGQYRAPSVLGEVLRARWACREGMQGLPLRLAACWISAERLS